MYTLYKRTTPIKDATGQIVGYNTIPVNVADDFFVQFGLVFDWRNKTVSRNGETYYLPSDDNKIPTPEEWLATYGNYVKTYYYAVGEDMEKNPSNNPKNIKRRVYYNSQNIRKYDIRFEFDINDNIVNESSIAPNKEGAVNCKLKIENSDPTTLGSVYEKLYADGTLVSINELKEILSAEISTYNLLGLKKNGATAYIQDFVITDDVTLTAYWQPKTINLTLKYNLDYDSDNAENEVVSKVITQGIGTTFTFNSVDVFNEILADDWKKSAFTAPQRFVVDGEEMGPNFSQILWTNTEINLVCDAKEFTLNIVDSEGETTISDTIKVGDAIDIESQVPEIEGKTIKSYIVDNEGSDIELEDNILTLNQDFFEESESLISNNTITIKYLYE